MVGRGRMAALHGAKRVSAPVEGEAGRASLGEPLETENPKEPYESPGVAVETPEPDKELLAVLGDLGSRE